MQIFVRSQSSFFPCIYLYLQVSCRFLPSPSKFKVHSFFQHLNIFSCFICTWSHWTFEYLNILHVIYPQRTVTIQRQPRTDQSQPWQITFFTRLFCQTISTFFAKRNIFIFWENKQKISRIRSGLVGFYSQTQIVSSEIRKKLIFRRLQKKALLSGSNERLSRLTVFFFVYCCFLLRLRRFVLPHHGVFQKIYNKYFEFPSELPNRSLRKFPCNWMFCRY